MKRCPTCNLVETDDALRFCRGDGTTLISYSGPVGAEAGAVRFDSSPISGEIETSILRHTATTPEIHRSTGPTTALPAPPTLNPTRELTKPKRRGVVFAAAGLAVIVIAIAGYFYLSRNHKAAIESIAVMPFVNDSGNAGVEYLSDGMTETLISSLSQLPNLSVKARSSVFRYKGKATDAKTIGKELNVQAILNGRVTQRGEQLTLSLELIDAQTENVIWGEQYNRKQTDLVTLQSEIARDVSNKLRVKLSGPDEQKLAKNYTANTEAYRLYLLGRFHWNKRTVSDFRKSIEYFQQAVIADPDYALAYAGLADSHMLNSEYDGEPPNEAIPKARETALKALSLDNQLAEAHTALGLVLSDDYNFAGAEREYKRALELNPNDATPHQRYGHLLTYFGRHEEGLAEVRRALEIEPLSLIVNRSYGDLLFYARRYDESIAQLKKTLELDANWRSAYPLLASAYWMKGDYAESVEVFAKYREVQGRQQDAVLVRESFFKGGWEGFLRMRIGELRTSTTNSYGVATYHAALGEKDEAFAALNKAYENHEYGILLLKVDPRLDPLRDDPRFQVLLKRLNLPE